MPPMPLHCLRFSEPPSCQPMPLTLATGSSTPRSPKRMCLQGKAGNVHSPINVNTGGDKARMMGDVASWCAARQTDRDRQTGRQAAWPCWHASISSAAGTHQSAACPKGHVHRSSSQPPAAEGKGPRRIRTPTPTGTSPHSGARAPRRA